MKGYGECVALYRLKLATEALYQLKNLVKYLCNVQGAPLTLALHFYFPDA